MLTNAIKKGMRVHLTNGWFGTVQDNLSGNTRIVEVEGFHKETGSVYVWDFKAVKPVDSKVWHTVCLTQAQQKARVMVSTFL